MCDAHRHCWQNQFRRILCDVDSLATYMASTHGGIALHYRPDDIFVGNCVSMLGALDSGVTTVLDFSHNSRSPEHSDAAFRAYAEIGGRVVHASAPPNAGAWDGQWPGDIARLAAANANPLATVRLGVDMSARWDTSAQLFAAARAMGVGITVDGVCMGRPSSDAVRALGAAGALGADVTLIHGTDLADAAWEVIAQTGTRITLAPTSDEQIGIADGDPPIQKALDHGIRPSLSVDVEIALSTDMFSQMRAVLTTQRMQVAKRRYHGDPQAPAMITVRDVLEFATACGARDMGLGAVTGSITPGKQADLVAITAEDVNNFPLNNAAGTVVLGADTRNIELVMVAGEVKKWGGALVWGDRGLDHYRALARASRDRIMAEAQFELDVLSDGRGFPGGSPLNDLVEIAEIPT
jgi:cytosine/adenosine deaminase-related metal-dependent hydrolase